MSLVPHRVCSMRTPGRHGAWMAHEGARGLRASVIDEQLVAYLMDAHAVEEQALGLLARARRACTNGELSGVYDEHLDRAELHRRLLEERLYSHDARPSALKDAAVRLCAARRRMVFQGPPCA